MFGALTQLETNFHYNYNLLFKCVQTVKSWQIFVVSTYIILLNLLDLASWGFYFYSFIA